jgi:hypothetical protein
MRSIFLHLKKTTSEAVAFALDEICGGRQGTDLRWVYPSAQRTALYLGFYVDYEEFEPEDWDKLQQTLRQRPDVSIIADVTGRESGQAEVHAIVRLILERFDGVAQDEYTFHWWTLDEIERGCSEPGANRKAAPPLSKKFIQALRYKCGQYTTPVLRRGKHRDGLSGLRTEKR